MNSRKKLCMIDYPPIPSWCSINWRSHICKVWVTTYDIITEKQWESARYWQQSNTFQSNSKVFDKKSQNKAEGLLLNSIASKQNITHRKIQLLTNKHQHQTQIYWHI